MAKDIKSKGIPNKDLYLILGVSDAATEKEILKGYRKKALKCHPDKNPDNPKAAEEFHELSLALEILTDAAAKSAYDQSRRAKKEVEERNKVLDSKRKKFKEDLEAREQAAEKNLQSLRFTQVDAEKKLQAEIERLREEGSRLLAEEQRRLHEILKSQNATGKGNTEFPDPGDIPRIKLKWKANKGDNRNGGYDSKILSDIFSCYGKIATIVVSSKRNGSAIVEFEPDSVISDIFNETGLSNNPLSILWLSGKPTLESNHSSYCYPSYQQSSDSDNFVPSGRQNSSVNFISEPDSLGKVDNKHSSSMFACGSSNNSSSFGNGQSYSSDFESLVLRKMRQAEERKKLIEQMKHEDGED